MLFDTLPTAPGRQLQALTKVSLKCRDWFTLNMNFTQHDFPSIPQLLAAHTTVYINSVVYSAAHSIITYHTPKQINVEFSSYCSLPLSQAGHWCKWGRSWRDDELADYKVIDWGCCSLVCIDPHTLKGWHHTFVVSLELAFKPHSPSINWVYNCAGEWFKEQDERNCV